MLLLSFNTSSQHLLFPPDRSPDSDDGHSTPLPNLHQPKSTDLDSFSLQRSNVNEQFYAGLSKKKASQLAGFEHETEKDEEEKESFEFAGNCLAFDGHHILVSALKDCIGQNDIYRGRTLHIEAVKKGLCESRSFVGNTLVHMYAECGMLSEAEYVFHSLPFRTIVAWTALIAGYANNGYGEDAFVQFEQMQQENVPPNRATYLSILKACANVGDVDKCSEIQSRIFEDGLENDVHVGTALVDMYGKCGCFELAQAVFDKMTVRNDVSFGALLSAFVQHGLHEKAIQCFEQMEHEGVSPNAINFISLLKVCGSMQAISLGIQIHMRTIQLGFLDDNAMLGNTLVDMYAKCLALMEAQYVFDTLRCLDVFSWNSLITGYSHYGTGEMAIMLLGKMQKQGFSPDMATFIALFKACSNLDKVFTGQQVHSEAIKKGFSDEMLLIVSIVEMYSSFGLLAEAQNVFESVTSKSLVLWNVLIAGYVQNGHSKEALNRFVEMQAEGLSPNLFTLTSILKACTLLEAAEKGEDILNLLEQSGLPELDMVAATTLMHMYGECGFIEQAQKVFNELTVHDLVSWSAMIKGYAAKGRGEEALECYEEMQLAGLCPNLVTLIAILKACGGIGATTYGTEIHAGIVKQKLVESDILVGTSLVDMYGKCGLVREATQIFQKLSWRNTVSWNALLAVYSQVGDIENAFKCFDAMIRDGCRPSIATFTIVFNTCSHAGLLDKGQLYFEVMKVSYELIPTGQQYNCMVDLFGRAGQVEKVIVMIQQMPVTASLTGWNIMLAACERYDVYYEALVDLSKIYIRLATNVKSCE